MYKRGAFSDKQIEKLIQNRNIINSDFKFINPASLDIRASAERYRISSVFMSKGDVTVRSLLPELNGHSALWLARQLLIFLRS